MPFDRSNLQPSPNPKLIPIQRVTLVDEEGRKSTVIVKNVPIHPAALTAD